MRLMDYAWRLGLPPTDGTFLIAKGQDWARSHGYKIGSSLALELGVGLEDGWKTSELRDLVRRRLPQEESTASLEPSVADVPEEETEQPGLLERLRSRAGEERLTETFELRVGANELAAWHAYAEREDKPLAWLVRRAMRDCVEFLQFKSANVKGATDESGDAA
jgi:hypothetical protein